jgi:rubrerythrin
MEKDAIIEILNKALTGEEKAVPIYNKHLSSSLFWTGIEKEKSERIKKILKKLANDSSRHKTTVEGLISKLKEEV